MIITTLICFSCINADRQGLVAGSSSASRERPKNEGSWVGTAV
jgi:hypothetical protein